MDMKSGVFSWYAGAAKRSLDPAPDMFPIPDPRPARDGRLFVQSAAYDSCSVRALAVGNQEKKILIISCELVSIPAVAELEKTVSLRTGIKEEDIYLTATHNHTAPFDRGRRSLEDIPEANREWYRRYENIERNAVVDAAIEAVSGMRSVRLEYAEGPSFININRDLKTPSGCWVEERNPIGVTDPTLSVLSFRDREGKLVAAVLNHATHCTCAFKMRDSDGLGKTSGNLSAVACRFVEEKYRQDGAVVLWTSGAAGDQGPVFPFGLQMEYPDGYSTMMEYPPGTGYLQMEYLGRRHGADAAGLLEMHPISEKNPHASTPALAAAVCSVDWPTQKKAEGSGGYSRMGGFGPRPDHEVHIGPPAVPKMEPDGSSAKIILRGLKLAHVFLLFINAELYVRFGLKLRKLCKEKFPGRELVVITHTGQGVGDIIDNESADHQVIQAYGRLIPGAADDRFYAVAEKIMEALEKGMDVWN